jgi:MGT family glycosyltransferase
MASILFYTSPARGHLFPVLGAAIELRTRGHEIHVRTLASEVERVRSLGMSAEPIAQKVESREMDDWKGNRPVKAVELAMKTFCDRSVPEVDDVQQALKKSGADILLVDTNSWGAQAVAESSGLPWAVFQPYFTFLPAPEVPPFGPGFARMNGVIGGIRNKLVGKILFSKLNKIALPELNKIRVRLALDPFVSLEEMVTRPPRLIYFTTKALEYPREKWPDNFRFVGPGSWVPDTEPPAWLEETDRPIVLVTCSTELQKDRPIVEVALQTLPEKGFFVVATSAAYVPEELEATALPNTRIERFIPHNPVVERAAVVICHGGMGITQRALSYGVPVVVIPFGRDQLEVARRVEFAGVGVRLLPKNLNRKTLNDAVQQALKMKDKAEQMAREMAASGGSSLAADTIEEILN